MSFLSTWLKAGRGAKGAFALSIDEEPLMDEVINKLIEIDREARKRVSKAKRSQLKGVASLDSKREEILRRNEEEFNKKIAELKKNRETIFNERRERISSEGRKKIADLEFLAEKSTDEWINKIYNMVIE